MEGCVEPQHSRSLLRLRQFFLERTITILIEHRDQPSVAVATSDSRHRIQGVVERLNRLLKLRDLRNRVLLPIGDPRLTNNNETEHVLKRELTSSSPIQGE